MGAVKGKLKALQITRLGAPLILTFVEGTLNFLQNGLEHFGIMFFKVKSEDIF